MSLAEGILAIVGLALLTVLVIAGDVTTTGDIAVTRGSFDFLGKEFERLQTYGMVPDKALLSDLQTAQTNYQSVNGPSTTAKIRAKANTLLSSLTVKDKVQ